MKSLTEMIEAFEPMFKSEDVYLSDNIITTVDHRSYKKMKRIARDLAKALEWYHVHRYEKVNDCGVFPATKDVEEYIQGKTASKAINRAKDILGESK